MAAADKGCVLIALAREAIALQLGMVSAESEKLSAAWLNETAATFVTLTKQGTLRGCIGSLEAYRSLRADVQANAVAAALHDPRFSPLSRDEYDQVRLEISVLTALQALDVLDEDDALRKIRPGCDGVVLQGVLGGVVHKATFLPQVWETLPDPSQFMAQLKLKAGLSAYSWPQDMRLFVYQVDKYRESAEGGL